MISGVVIARNEEEMIPGCLESLKWVDEIIVIDNGSRDRTSQIAKKFGAKVFRYEKIASEGNFSKIREFAISKVKEGWILFVDADERVTPELRDEIERVVQDPDTFSAFAIPRRNILLGHEMKYGGWSPDYVLRIIRKDKVKGYSGAVHEQPQIEGEVGKLKEPFVHITHRSLVEMVEKTNKWSEIEARLMYEAHHPKMNVLRFMGAMAREFWYRGIVKLGFLDGPVGIIEIMFQVFNKFVVYAKLWEMQINA